MRIINIRIGKIYLYVHVDEQDGDVVTTDWTGKDVYNEILEQKLKVEKSVIDTETCETSNIHVIPVECDVEVTLETWSTK